MMNINIYNILKTDEASIKSLCLGTEAKLTTIQDGLCPPSSWHPSGKRLTVTLGGVWPYIVKSASGGVGGTDLKILDLLAKKFNFSVSLKPINTHKEYYATVRSPLSCENQSR